jgi:hypothetical protein
MKANVCLSKRGEDTVPGKFLYPGESEKKRLGIHALGLVDFVQLDESLLKLKEELGAIDKGGADLKGRYPRNFNFAFSLANILSDLRQYDEAFALAREIEKNIQSGKDPYGSHLTARYNLLMGRIFFGRFDIGHNLI